jgi:hypothetical protein
VVEFFEQFLENFLKNFLLVTESAEETSIYYYIVQKKLPYTTTYRTIKESFFSPMKNLV